MRQQSGYGPMRGQSQFRTRGGRQSNNNFNRFGNNNNNNNDYDNDYDDDYDNYDDDDNGNGNDNDMDNNMGFGNNNNNGNNGWNNNGPSNNRRWVAKRVNGNNNNNFSSFGNNNNNNSNDFYERKQQQGGGVGGTRSQLICQNITQYMKELGNALESESDSKMCEMLSFRHYTRNDITRIVGNASPRMIDTLGNQYLSKNNVSFQWKEILKCNIIAQKYSNQFDIFEKQRLRKMENRLNNSNNSNDNSKPDNGGMSENDEALVVDQKHPLHQAYSSLQSMMEKIEIMIKADSICSKANNNSNNNNNNSRRSADENNRVWYSRCLKVLTTFWVNTTIKLHYLYVEDTNNQRDVDMSNGGGNSNSNSNNNNEDDSSEDYLQKSFLTGIQIFNAMDNEIDELLRMSNKSSNNNNMARGGIYHGLYYMANIIIRLSEVKNAPTYISDVIKATKKLDDSEYPYSDVVTTQYYYASYSIKNDKLDDAIIALQKAFNASRSAKYGGNAAFRNKVRILILYIPVKLTFAQFPKPQYLKKYGLYDHFWPIVVALRTGNLLLFESCMEYYSKDFISKDCYLLIDRLRLLVFVQLIRNIYKTQCNAENDNLTLPQGKGSEVIWFDTIQYANRLMNNEYFQSQFYKQFEYTYSKNEMKKIESFLNTNDNSNNNDNNNNNKSKNKENDVSNKIEETTLTLDEIAALCSTVVFKSLVKGYVAPKRCLVLSKKFYPFTRPQDAKLKNNQNKKWYEWEF